MLKTSTFLAVAGLVVAGAVVNGAATNRWTIFPVNQDRTDRLHALVLRFQDWQASEVPTDMPLNEQSKADSRRYASPSSGRSGVVTIISGIPGSVSTHTPDVCYPGSGYQTLRAPKKETIELPGGQSAEVYVADFEKKTQTKADRVRVRWAWMPDGTWIAPNSPRWQFATRLTQVPVLYKLYATTPLAEDSESRPEDDETTRAFVTAALSQYAAAFGK